MSIPSQKTRIVAWGVFVPVREMAGRMQDGLSVVLLATVVLALGRPGGKGPEKYEVTGMITYDGLPIPNGEIYFEPTEVPVTHDTYGQAITEDGRYTAEIVGGPHVVYVRELVGTYDLDPQELPPRPLLPTGEWKGPVDFPSLEEMTSRQDSRPVEFNFEIPVEKR